MREPCNIHSKRSVRYARELPAKTMQAASLENTRIHPPSIAFIACRAQFVRTAHATLSIPPKRNNAQRHGQNFNGSMCSRYPEAGMLFPLLDTRCNNSNQKSLRPGDITADKTSGWRNITLIYPCGTGIKIDRAIHITANIPGLCPG